jgi:beta-phosphoglucomutase
MKFDRKLNNQLRGVSRKDSLEIILKHNGLDVSDQIKKTLMDRKNDYYLEQLTTFSPKDILPGVMETLDGIRKKGILMAIGSSSKNAKTILARIGLSDYFDFVVDSNMIERGKPFPDVFLNASTYFHIEPAFCMVVEDARSGIDAAKNAGMIACAISDACGYEKADIHLNKITDLLTYVKEE